MRLKRTAARALTVCFCVGALGLTAACSPALDWRDVRLTGATAAALIPCKPSAQQRQLMLAGVMVRVSLQACSATGLTWGLIAADVMDPARVGAALDELLAASARNVAAATPMVAASAAARAFAPPGSTPNAHSRRMRLIGSLPDGSQAQLETAVFSHGTWVFQATVLGEGIDAEAAETFFTSLHIAS